MNKKIISGCLLFLLVSCRSTERQAIRDLDRIKTHYPHLFNTRYDTTFKDLNLVVIAPPINNDTTIVTYADTLDIVQNGVMTHIERVENANGEKTYYVKTDVEPRTITLTIRDTSVIVKTEFVTAVKKVVPLWLWLIVAGLVSLLVATFLRKINFTKSL